jgi:ElaB/YqjD/DUF883 family membrane-anchored ribosome-binding protein
MAKDMTTASTVEESSRAGMAEEQSSVSHMKQRVHEVSDQVKERAREMGGQVKNLAREVPSKMKAAGRGIDEQVHAHPMAVTGAVAALGIGLGVLFAKSRMGRLLILGLAGFGAYQAFFRGQAPKLMGQVKEKARELASETMSAPAAI